MKNIPEVKIGLVVSSVDYLPSELAIAKRKELADKYCSLYDAESLYECQLCLGDSEMHIKRALKELENAGCNALCVFLADYGAESTGTLLAQDFSGPVMFCALAEDDANSLQEERKDSYSGLLNSCYALYLRSTKVYIPVKPIGSIEKCAHMIRDFRSVAAAVLAVKQLKLISFGPRPASYYAAYAPEHALHALGVELEINSELELLNAYEKHKDDRRKVGIVAEMQQEMGTGCISDMSLLERMAQFELTLRDWIRNHKGSRKFVTLTNTCWPAFPISFGFVPCYVNSRLTLNGFPVACEVDVMGAVSEYIGQCVSGKAVTILNINNTLPLDVFEEQIRGHQFAGKEYVSGDVFMGYHCGVTGSAYLEKAQLKPHYVNCKLIGEEKSGGTIQGSIKPGPVTLFRLQATLTGGLKAYVVQGQILPVSLKTYGGRAVLAVPEMERFYRHVLIEEHYPNHTVVLFGHYGKLLSEALTALGIKNISYNHPQNIPYQSESVYAVNNEWY